MRNFLLTLLLSAISFGGIYAQNITKELELNNFNKIHANFAYTVNISKGTSDHIEVIYPERFEDYLDISVSNNTLYLKAHTINKKQFDIASRQSEMSPKNGEEIIVNIKMEELKMVNLDGSATLTANGDFKAEAFDLSMGGASKIVGFLNINADKFSYSLSGVAEAAVTGFFNRVKGHISGSSEFELIADATTLFLGCSGASEFDFRGNISERTDIECSGASEANLRGKSFITTIYCSGASKVEAEELHSIDATATATGASFIKVHADNSFSLRTSGASNIRYYGNAQYTQNDDSGSIGRGWY